MNPFEDQHTASDNPFTDSSIINSSNINEPTFISQTIPVPLQEKPSQRELDLIQREAEINRREAELNLKQKQLDQHGLHPPNWPLFYPVIYHDIQTDISEDNQLFVTRAYKYWILTVCNLVFNMFSVFLLLIVPGGDVTSAATDFGVSLVYCFTISASSFVLWYRPLYLGYKQTSSLYLTIALLFGGFHILFCFYMAIGFVGSGSGGFINMFLAFASGKVFVGVLFAIDLSIWLLMGLVCLYGWKTVHGYYRASGMTLESAKNSVVASGINQAVSV